jgi:hypothetical protein
MKGSREFDRNFDIHLAIRFMKNKYRKEERDFMFSRSNLHNTDNNTNNFYVS